MSPRPKKPSEKSSSKLLEAIRFLSFITKDEGQPNETHIVLNNKTATAFNGVISAGQLIDEEITAYPHNQTLLSALSKCGQQFAITQLDNNRLSIKSGKFKAIVPCIESNLLNAGYPDQPCAVIDDRLKEALTKIEPIKSNEERIIAYAFLLNGPSVIATDGKILFECWHGIDLPVIAIPKILIPAIIKNSKRLTKFGFSSSSVTFFFEDDSWIKSQLYKEQWPSISHITDIQNNAIPIPSDFFTALEAVAPFSEGNVYFEDGKLCSHNVENTGANYEVSELQKGPVFAIKYLQMIKEHATKIDFYVRRNMLYFYGNQCRGVIAGYG